MFDGFQDCLAEYAWIHRDDLCMLPLKLEGTVKLRDVGITSLCHIAKDLHCSDMTSHTYNAECERLSQDSFPLCMKLQDTRKLASSYCSAESQDLLQGPLILL
jgi:hypothetical protein